MLLMQANGFSCSTFDAGNMDINNQDACCEVSDTFEDYGFNFGSIVFAARFIMKQDKPVSWEDFENWVMDNGGFLTPALRKEVHALWNCQGNTAYSLEWADGLIPVGQDRNGLVWQNRPNKTNDSPISGSFRKNIFDGLTRS